MDLQSKECTEGCALKNKPFLTQQIDADTLLNLKRSRKCTKVESVKPQNILLNLIRT
jgi:hypothetical protein